MKICDNYALHIWCCLLPSKPCKILRWMFPLNTEHSSNMTTRGWREVKKQRLLATIQMKKRRRVWTRTIPVQNARKSCCCCCCCSSCDAQFFLFIPFFCFCFGCYTILGNWTINGAEMPILSECYRSVFRLWQGKFSLIHTCDIQWTWCVNVAENARLEQLHFLFFIVIHSLASHHHHRTGI